MRSILKSLLCLSILLASEFLLAQGWCAGGFSPGGGGPPVQSPSPTCGPSGPCCECQKSPAYVKTGTYAFTTTDLQVPGTSLSVDRSYESSRPSQGATGFAWASNATSRLYYATYLFAAPSTYRTEAAVRLPDGRRFRFKQDPATGSFAAEPGRRDSLVRNGDGTFDLTTQEGKSVHRFDAQGNLLTITDTTGRTTTYSYSSGRVNRIADSVTGRYIDIFWGADGRISTVRDSNGTQVQYNYDGQGSLTSVTDPVGRVTTYVYSPGRLGPILTQIKDNWNRILTDVTYDSQNRVKSYTENGRTHSYDYLNSTQTKKGTYTYTYNADGLVTAQATSTATPVTLNTTSYNADGSIQQLYVATVMTSGTTTAGVKTTYTYTPDGKVASVTQDDQGPLAIRWEYTYDTSFPDKIARVTPKRTGTNLYNEDWQVTEYDYYQVGSPSPGSVFHVYRLHSDGTTRDLTSTYTYDTQGRVICHTTGSGASTDYVYNVQGDLLSVTGPANNDTGTRPVTTYTYGSTGKVATVTSPLGHVTSYSHDAVGRVLTVTLPKPTAGSTLDFTTRYTYDNYEPESGLVFIHITDPNGNLTRSGYDQFGRLGKSIDSAGNVTSYATTLNPSTGARTLRITDANGNVTTNSYDSSDRLETILFPDGTSETYYYNLDGTFAGKRNRNSQTVGYTYDSLKRVIGLTYGGGPLPVVTFTYQGQKLKQVVDTSISPSETHTFTYDSLFRVASNTQATRGTLSYTYTTEDRVATLGVAGGPSTSYGFNPDGSLKTIDWSPVANPFRYSYTLDGQYQQVTFPSGHSRGYSYDQQGRLLELANTLGATNLATYAYGYDFNYHTGASTMLGQRTSLTAAVPTQGFVNALTKYYYDPLYQLNRVDYPSTAPFNGEINSWTYDAIGNRVTNTVNGTTQSYTYFKNGSNPNNGQRLQNDGTSTYAYDQNGSVISRTGFTFGLDSLIRLTSITGGIAATYTYDYEGRRTSKTVGGVKTTYLYDGQNLIRETTSGVSTDFIFGAGVDEPLGMHKGGGLSYFVADGLGSVAVTSNPSGAVSHSAVFDAWGAQRSETGTRNYPFSYAGREVGEAGLLAYRARFYRPSVGRFQQEDPLLNPAKSAYWYVENSPVLYLDPSGMIPVTLIGISNAEIQKRCLGSGSIILGCARLISRFDWKCVCRPDKSWMTSVKLVTPTINLFYSNDCHKVTTGEIIEQEQRHVRNFEKNWAKIEDLARDLRNRKFASFEACEQVARWTRDRATVVGTEGDDTIDRTHPWKSCN